MVFISSTIPFGELTNLKNAYPDMWFLFQDNIKNKKYTIDDRLDNMRSLMMLYPVFYTKTPVYCYLMTNNHYYKSEFHKMNPNICEVRVVENIPYNLSDIEQHPNKYIRIEKDKRICLREDIIEIFEAFANNNFKENPICEVIISNEITVQRRV